MWGIGIFSIGAAGPLIPELRETSAGLLLTGLSIAGAALVLLYEGFVFFASKAIPFWHTKLLPLLYVAYGLRGGAALLLVAAAVGGGAFDLGAVEAIKLWVVVSSAVLILLYVVAARRAGGASLHAARQLVAGRISPSFYGGTVLIGIVVPLALALARELGTAGLLVVGMIGVASLVGDFYVKYCVVKAGTYVPIRDSLRVPTARSPSSARPPGERKYGGTLRLT
jgi:formate-dependent nitrite reductase membrane component NrfD